MQIGIMGLPGAGKTTVFNALARAKVQVASYSAPGSEPHKAVVKVPDPRLEALAALFQPEKITPAEVQYLDVAGLTRGIGKEGGGATLAHLRNADALLHVVRAFNSIAAGPPDPVGDVEAVELELALADLEVLGRRLERLERESRLARGTEVERQLRERELALLGELQRALEGGRPLRDLAIAEEDLKLLRGYALLTLKPMLVLLNLPDEGGDAEALEARVRARLPWQNTMVASLRGRIEMELADLSLEDAAEFMADMGITELGLVRVIQLSYRLMDLISFFTVGEDEVRAWTIRRGTTAVEAAGVIHSDIQRGFIRAEIVPAAELLRLGSLAEARRQGVLRQEGKTYVMADGDVAHFLFNVGR